ncbi:hypothetical protein C8J35_10914 [Rhizobium sp. PP-F2F-G38]|nr:hypothetical protein C8J35_10914 [Rhizobium sp. PP-F2F-G38]
MAVKRSRAAPPFAWPSETECPSELTWNVDFFEKIPLRFFIDLTAAPMASSSGSE